MSFRDFLKSARKKLEILVLASAFGLVSSCQKQFQFEKKEGKPVSNLPFVVYSESTNFSSDEYYDSYVFIESTNPGSGHFVANASRNFYPNLFANYYYDSITIDESCTNSPYDGKTFVDILYFLT
jgi:hypothetical protein